MDSPAKVVVKPPARLRCTDGCGNTVLDVAEANAKAWTRLEITNRYRCPPCVRLLNEINGRICMICGGQTPCDCQNPGDLP